MRKGGRDRNRCDFGAPMTDHIPALPAFAVGLEDNKLVQFTGGLAGIDVHRISTSHDYYRASSVEEMGRNMVFLEFTAVRNAGEMIFVTDSILRDTLITKLAEAGCTVPENAAVTGHSLRLRAQPPPGVT
jgi:hypothetical protein